MAREYWWRRGSTKKTSVETEGRISLAEIQPGETLMRLVYQPTFWNANVLSNVSSLEQLRDRIMWGVYVWDMGGAFPAPLPMEGWNLWSTDQNWIHWMTDTWDVNYTHPQSPSYGYTNQHAGKVWDIGSRRAAQADTGMNIQLSYQSVPDWNPLAPIDFLASVSFALLVLRPTPPAVL